MPLLTGLETDKRTLDLVPCHKPLPAFSIYSGQVLLWQKPGFAVLPCCSTGLVSGDMFGPLPKLHLLNRESTESLSAKITMNLERILKCIHKLKTELQRARLFYYYLILASFSRAVFIHI